MCSEMWCECCTAVTLHREVEGAIALTLGAPFEGPPVSTGGEDVWECQQCGDLTLQYDNDEQEYAA